MKKHLITLLAVVTLHACSGDENSSEIEQKRKELLEKKAELKEQQEIAALDAEIKQLDRQLKKPEPASASASASTSAKNLDEAKRGRIKGDQVGLRQSATVQSERIASFNKGETVDITAHTEGANTNEAILTQSIQFYYNSSSGSSSMHTLPEGKAVVLQEYIQSSDSYRVNYQHPELGKLEAVVKANLLNNILNQKWYQVRRANGQTGWVLGKYLDAI